jgi:restriction endonuclease Mrr
MTLDEEEQVLVLYALYRCGGKGSKARIIQFIVENGLLKPRDGDTEIRQNGERKYENDLAWASESLKEKKFLTRPKHGIWQITDLGRERMFGVAKAIYSIAMLLNDNNDWSFTGSAATFSFNSSRVSSDVSFVNLNNSSKIFRMGFHS